MEEGQQQHTKEIHTALCPSCPGHHVTCPLPRESPWNQRGPGSSRPKSNFKLHSNVQFGSIQQLIQVESNTLSQVNRRTAWKPLWVSLYEAHNEWEKIFHFSKYMWLARKWHAKKKKATVTFIGAVKGMALASSCVKVLSIITAGCHSHNRTRLWPPHQVFLHCRGAEAAGSSLVF